MSRLTVTEYAQLSVQLAHAAATPGASADRLLLEAQLTAEEWDAETLYWEAEMSRALDHEDEVPQLLLDYSGAVQAAQAALVGGPLELETFSQILGEMQRGTPLDHALRQRHISLPDFLTAQRHWMTQAMADPSVRDALEAALR